MQSILSNFKNFHWNKHEWENKTEIAKWETWEMQNSPLWIDLENE